MSREVHELFYDIIMKNKIVVHVKESQNAFRRVEASYET
jgi:hypothetical protein